MPLPALIQSGKPSAQWNSLCDAPLKYCGAIGVHGSLLAIGGRNDRRCSSAIHVYDQERNVWDKVGDLPNVQSSCTCCLLLSAEILVAGGQDRKGGTS